MNIRIANTLVIILLFVLIVLSLFFTGEKRVVQPENPIKGLKPNVVDTANLTCGDGICDLLEKGQGNCTKDCKT